MDGPRRPYWIILIHSFWKQSLRRLKKKKVGEEGLVIKRLKVKRDEIWISLRKLERANRIIPTKIATTDQIAEIDRIDGRGEIERIGL